MKVSELKKRDVIVCGYGFSDVQMIIKANDPEQQRIVFTTPSWLKRECVALTYRELISRGFVYLTRYSKLRWFLKF